MKFTELVTHPVMDLATATSIGRIDDAVVDAAHGTSVRLRAEKDPGEGDWLAWDQVNAVGADALTVRQCRRHRRAARRPRAPAARR